MSIIDELTEIAETTSNAGEKIEAIRPAIDAINNVASQVAKSSSGSWFGYQSRVYYADFQIPPPGFHFSQMWGFYGNSFVHRSKGDWREYQFDDVVSYILENSNAPSIETINTNQEEIIKCFEQAKRKTLLLVGLLLKKNNSDEFLNDISIKIKGTVVFDTAACVHMSMPKGNLQTRDQRAIDDGINTPPHIFVMAQTTASASPYLSCRALAERINEIIQYLKYSEEYNMESTKKQGSKIFIGHGRSMAWRDLKDFLTERLKLEYAEFDSEPAAGMQVTERLIQMLIDSKFAFLVLTAEDEQDDGSMRARQNVIHEAGLFQGKLGFKKAIILLEEGCQDFSNIAGIIVIRFPKGNIKSIFEQIRSVLEREKLI